MPSFSDETIEQWRRERVMQTSTSLEGGDPKLIAQTIREDLTEERWRLARAQAQVTFSLEAIKRLEKRLAALKTK